jgi:hypothetical protein
MNITTAAKSRAKWLTAILFFMFTCFALTTMPAANATTLEPVIKTEATSMPAGGTVTLVPQDDTSAPVQNVNTAATVRVNNLANMEAMLSIIANVGEVVGVLWGSYLIVTAAQRAKPSDSDLKGEDSDAGTKKSVQLTKRVFHGLTMLALGLMLPGVINWLVASARDASLCGN